MIKTKLIKHYSFFTLCFSTILLVSFTYSPPASSKNGFNLNHLNIEVKEIFHGGPDKDGIPSIDNPQFINATEVDFLHHDDMVMSFTEGSITKAYPLRILIWHEIVNDIINNKAIAVTYCPLCGTGMVFDRLIDDEVKSFGVSGLLYRSDVLMYDRETHSLWSQLGLKGVSHKAVDKKLKWLPSEQLTWQAWKQKYPQGKVLSTKTGFNRQYASQAYEHYFASEYPMFSVPKFRNELNDKDKIIGIIINGIAKAYPLTLLQKEPNFNDQIGETKITIDYDHQKKLTTIKDSNLQHIASVEAYWFAWQTFYPETLIKLK